MKKLSLLILVILFSVNLSFTQSDRMSLMESFTSSTCYWCGVYNPGMDALLHSNEDKITSIKYHMNWPSPGNDPMYWHNPQDNNARKNYYGVSGIPHCVVDGNFFVGSPGSFTQATINNASSVPSPFEMQMQHSLSADEDTVFITMIIEATDDVSGTLVGHMVVIEKHIHFSSPPGTNGERDFYNVMKKMLPSSSGTALDNFGNGEYIILEDSWKLANIYDMDELSAVGFVQDNLNKDVHQACNSSTDPITLPYDNDVEVTSISNLPKADCSGSLYPIVQIRNNGNNTLTEVTLKYKVNSEELQTFEWTGSLGSLEKANVALPELLYNIEDENELMVYAEDVNNQSDEYPKNDTNRKIVEGAMVTPDEVKLYMVLDDNPEEISWEIKDSNGEVVYSGGDYTEPGEIISETFDFPNVECYTFDIWDSGKDGLDPGYFIFYYGSNNIILQGSEFGDHKNTQFSTNGYVNIPEPEKGFEMDIYPNPVNASAIIDFNLASQQKVLIEMYNLTGRCIKASEPVIYGLGRHQYKLETNNLDNGFYFVRVKVADRVYTKKLTVVK